MPKIDIQNLPVRTGSGYPDPYGQQFDDRAQVRLGDPAGLTQFGVNLVRLEPGAMSSLRHWHEKQDEFLVVTEGTCTLVDDTGETALTPGECAAFPAGDANGHHIVNRSDETTAFVVVGTRTETEVGYYSDIDMMVTVDASGMNFTRKNGDPV